jgi:hypothetical protein
MLLHSTEEVTVVAMVMLMEGAAVGEAAEDSTEGATARRHDL